MWEYIGEHLGELSAIIAVLVSAYTAWSRNKTDKETIDNDESRITKEFGDSVINLIQPLNERIDALVKSQDEYMQNISIAIAVLKECRDSLDIALKKMENYKVVEVKGTRAMVEEIKKKVS